MPNDKPVRIYHQIPEDYPDEFIECRVDRHSWVRPHIIDPHFNAPFGYPVYRECETCGAFWGRAYNRSMTQKVWERRAYPPGYLMRGFRSKQIQYVRLLIERENTEFINGDSL